MLKPLAAALILCFGPSTVIAQDTESWDFNQTVASIISVAEVPNPTKLSVVCADAAFEVVMSSTVANPISFDDGLIDGFRVFINIAFRGDDGELNLMGYSTIDDLGVEQFSPAVEFDPGQYTLLMDEGATNVLINLMQTSTAIIIERAEDDFDRDNASETAIREVFSLAGFADAIAQLGRRCGL